MSDNHPNYREAYFQHPTLTKISSDPTYTSLPKLEREIKANRKSVPSTLGGGCQGHLGLVSSPYSYDHRVSPGVPFTRLALPELPDLGGSTAHQIEVAEEIYALEVFKIFNLLERTIIQQINTAVDPDCLADLIDDETGLLEGPVHLIMTQLFETYGAITPQTLTSAKAALETTTYNHAKPITTVFTAINEYANMAEAAESAEMPTQLINISLIIITRSMLFSSDIRKWHSKEDTEKNWPAFKSHFKEAQRDIKRSQPTVTTDSLGYHNQVNAATIVDQVIERLSAEQMQHELQQQEMANATQQDGMIEQMQHLMTTISDLQTQVTNNNKNNRNNNNNNSNNNSNSNGNSNGSNNGSSNGNGSGNGNGNSNNTRGRSNGYQGRNNGYQGCNNGYQGRGRGRGRSQGRERTGTAAQPRKYFWTHDNCAQPRWHRMQLQG
jgi:hypothetical protein